MNRKVNYCTSLAAWSTEFSGRARFADMTNNQFQLAQPLGDRLVRLRAAGHASPHIHFAAKTLLAPHFRCPRVVGYLGAALPHLAGPGEGGLECCVST